MLCLFRMLWLGAFLTIAIAWTHAAGGSSGTPGFLQRPPGVFSLRVLNWNVWHSSVLPPDGQRQESFARIVRAVNPDVLCLQEVIGPRAPALSGLLDRLLPLEEGKHWQVHYRTNGDTVIASRFPLRQYAQEDVVPVPLSYFREFCFGHLMSLVDVPDSLCPVDFYIISVHFRSRAGESNIRARQLQADSLVRWLRRLRDPRDAHGIPARTPILIVGDFNVLDSNPADPSHHLTTVITGNIIDEHTFGPDLQPDWDGTYLVEAKPRHNGRGKDYYTWRMDPEPYPPGALDRILYTDSVVAARNSFVLNTTAMSEDELRQSGLQHDDVLRTGKAGEFDHLPMVVDFVFQAR